MMLRLVLVIAALAASACAKKADKPADNDDNVVDVAEDDAVMNKAIADARAHVEVFARELAAPATERSFAVKREFGRGSVTEHMWLVDVTAVDGGFEGRLDNKPRDASLAIVGERYKVKREELSDWMIVEPDGRIAGAYTLRAVLPTMSPEERAQYESALLPLP